MNEGKSKSCQNSLHLNTGLAQDYGISSVFATGIQTLGHITYIRLVEFGKLGSCNSLLSEGNWTPSRLCTFADYS